MAGHHSDLIDTTEMYLRTVYELEEEGVTPLRARIAERLSQSGPTVSQTVARMERDGLVHVMGDRHLELTDEGRRHAIAVMRKHRLAERLLADVIGLEWAQVHTEACRWEHVMSDAVERRIVAMLDKPLVCPHGNPIPGLDDLGLPFNATDVSDDLITMAAAGGQGARDVAMGDQAETPVEVARISEHIQYDEDLMRDLRRTGIVPGERVTLTVDGKSMCVRHGNDRLDLGPRVSEHIFVRLLPTGSLVSPADAAAGSATSDEDVPLAAPA